MSPPSHKTSSSTTPVIQGPNVWVKKWVDYSTKYGLGYLLSNNATGVFFNDSTKIVMDPDGKRFYYYERKAVSSTEKQDVMSTHSLEDYPKDLQKKVTLL
jgi:polo-like kinase 1